MKTRALLFSLVVLPVLTNQSFAEVRTNGELAFDGKTVSYEFVGENSVSASGSARNDTATIKGNVDGTAHQIDITRQKLTWNKKSFKLEDYKKIEIVIGNDTASIKVDGKEILPKKE